MKFSFQLKGDFKAIFAEYGLSNATVKNVPVTVPVSFTAGPRPTPPSRASPTRRPQGKNGHGEELLTARRRAAAAARPMCPLLTVRSEYSKRSACRDGQDDRHLRRRRRCRGGHLRSPVPAPGPHLRPALPARRAARARGHRGRARPEQEQRVGEHPRPDRLAPRAPRPLPGSRKDHYEAATGFWRVMQEIMERRFRWTVRQVLATIADTERAAGESRDAASRRHSSRPG